MVLGLKCYRQWMKCNQEDTVIYSKTNEPTYIKEGIHSVEKKWFVGNVSEKFGVGFRYYRKSILFFEKGIFELL